MKKKKLSLSLVSHKLLKSKRKVAYGNVKSSGNLIDIQTRSFYKKVLLGSDAAEDSRTSWARNSFRHEGNPGDQNKLSFVGWLVISMDFERNVH